MRCWIFSKGKYVSRLDLPTNVLYFSNTDVLYSVKDKHMAGADEIRNKSFHLGFPGSGGELVIDAGYADCYDAESGRIFLEGPVEIAYYYHNPKASGEHDSTLAFYDAVSKPLWLHGIKSGLMGSAKADEADMETGFQKPAGTMDRRTRDRLDRISRNIHKKSVRVSFGYSNLFESSMYILLAGDTDLVTHMGGGRYSVDFMWLEANIDELMGVFSAMSGTMTVTGRKDYARKPEDPFSIFGFDAEGLEKDIEKDEADYKKIEMELVIPWRGEIVATW